VHRNEYSLILWLERKEVNYVLDIQGLKIKKIIQKIPNKEDNLF